MLPTYIIIGAMKCGTTSLHRYLSAHPQIAASTRKELDFFKTDQDLAKGVAWYASQFDATYSVRGEASPNYSKCHLFPAVPKRMHAIVPECKIIYIVRDPAERAISHYLHSWVKGRESRPVAKAFQSFENNNYILTGQYMFQLERFLEYYPQDQVFVLTSDELRNDRQATLSRIFRVLGVDDAFVSTEFAQIHHRTLDRRRANPLARLARRVPGVSALTRRVIPTSTLRRMRKIGATTAPSLTIDHELRNRLVEHYTPELQRLSPFLTGETPVWLATALAAR